MTTPAGGLVSAAWLHPGQVSHVFMESMKELAVYDACHNRRMRSHAYAEIKIRCGAGGLVSCRNKVVTRFLDESPAEWLFMVDADMGFAHDTVDRLVDAADAETRPMVGGLCFAGAMVGESSFGGFRSIAMPTVYDWLETPEQALFAPRLDYERDALVSCNGTGAACVLMHRSLLESMRAEFGDNWYKPVSHPKFGTTYGEDLSFCMKAQRLGAPIFVHTGVRTTHDKGFAFLDEDYFLAQQGRVEAARELVSA